MTQEYTPLLRAAQARQCHIQRGTDMLFEMILPICAFDLPVATPSSCGRWQKFATDATANRVI